jgi:tripeptide aminopeptidase
VKPIVEGDWVRSDGSTILGADDKSGVAVILEALTVLKEGGIPHLPLELAFTVREEVGLLGALSLDLGASKVPWGIVLDHGEPVEAMVVRAPSQNSLDVLLRGRAAHAGVEPEKGISAIRAAAEAIAALPLGRIDEETTANVGTIQGGSARNIVPEEVRLQAEARSHDPAKLQAQTERMVRAFQEKAASLGAQAQVQVSRAYTGYSLSPETEIVQRVLAAGQALGLALQLTSTGGGSDANVFNERGITTIILSSGYRDNHTTHEAQHIPSLAQSARLLVEVLRAGG